MSVKEAKNHYLGLEGYKRANCAEAIICAFMDKFELDEDTADSFRQFGGGRAPEGACGAFYAAKYILETKCPEKVSEFEKFFIDNAGALKCCDIKSRRTPCVACVEKSAEYLSNISDEKSL